MREQDLPSWLLYRLQVQCSHARKSKIKVQNKKQVALIFSVVLNGEMQT